MKTESHFSTDQLLPRERFPVWRDSINVLYEVELGPKTNEDEFHGSIDGFLYDDLMIARVRTSAQRYRRNKAKIAADGVDHMMVQLFFDGSQQIRRGRRDVVSKPGDLMIHDFAADHVADSSAMDNLSLVIPRHVIEPLLKRPDSQHGRLLSPDRSLAQFLIRHIRDLYELAPTMVEHERWRMNAVSAALVAATLNGTRDDIVENAGALAVSTLLRAKRVIEANLDRPEMSVAEIAKAAGLSRASLYRLFEPFGGVRRYIQRRRLACCFRQITDPAFANRAIADIAYDNGFNSEAHFSHAFKREFSMTPSQARHDNATPPVRRVVQAQDPQIGDREYERWITETLRF